MDLNSLTVLASGEGGHDPLAIMMQTLPAGIIAAGVFALLGLVTLSYRNVANRHSGKAEKFAAQHSDEHGAGH